MQVSGTAAAKRKLCPLKPINYKWSSKGRIKEQLPSYVWMNKLGWAAICQKSNSTSQIFLLFPLLVFLYSGVVGLKNSKQVFLCRVWCRISISSFECRRLDIPVSLFMLNLQSFLPLVRHFLPTNFTAQKSCFLSTHSEFQFLTYVHTLLEKK